MRARRRRYIHFQNESITAVRKRLAALWENLKQANLRIRNLYLQISKSGKVILKSIAFFVIGYCCNVLIDRSHFNPAFFNPSQSYFDVDITDYFVSFLHQVTTKQPHSASEILLIDITGLDREGLAALLLKIGTYEPGVTAVDVYLEDAGNARANAELKKALGTQCRLVIGQQLSRDGKTIPVNQVFDQSGVKGVLNFISHDSTSVIRFIPVKLIKDKLCFAAAAAVQYNPDLLDQLKNRGNLTERIWYDPELAFNKATAGDIMLMTDSTELSMRLSGKIVLLGNVGMDARTWSLEDMHFTPANRNYVGRAFPDRYGVEIHAYALTTLLTGNYTFEVPEIINLGIALLIVCLGIWWETVLSEKVHPLFRIAIVTIALIASVAAYYFLFRYMHIAVDSSGILTISGLSLLCFNMSDLVQKFKEKKHDKAA